MVARADAPPHPHALARRVARPGPGRRRRFPPVAPARGRHGAARPSRDKGEARHGEWCGGRSSLFGGEFCLFWVREATEVRAPNYGCQVSTLSNGKSRGWSTRPRDLKGTFFSHEFPSNTNRMHDQNNSYIFKFIFFAENNFYIESR